ncbi:MAG: hypothetical protein HKN70_13465 [Gammaproteobacteria bacterium]|nr:hypothetical protein [Gammaproteobacteria bacterium]
MRRINKYLDRYAECEAALAQQLFEQCPRPAYQRVVVIPAFDETKGFCKRLMRHPDADTTLLIAVINRPCDDAVSAAGKRSRALWSELVSHTTELANRAHLHLRTVNIDNRNLDILLIDHCTGSRCLPAAEGVGRARKCGADAALALIRCQQIRCDWIYSTDADAWLPDNYFAPRREDRDVAAIHCGFEHFSVTGTGIAQQLYDLGMHFYVSGLAHAGSPYAHYSLGSALIINALHYAAVRGFPRRPAGEDFYLLNKLAKVGRIEHDLTITIRLEERESRRTPYGTGPAVRRIAQLDNPERDHAFYHPEGFELLKIWLQCAETANSERAFITRQGAHAWLHQQRQLQPYRLAVITALDELGMIEFLDRALKTYSSKSQFLHQFHGHFDALKTLRFIHALRDHALGTVNAATARIWLAQWADARSKPMLSEP